MTTLHFRDRCYVWARSAGAHPRDRRAENRLLQARRSLETRGFIFRHRRSDPQNGSLTTYYELTIDGQPHCTPECASDCAPSRKTDATPSRKTDGTPSHPQDGPPP